MSLSEYLSDNLDSIAMITLSTDQKELSQYNYWNWFPEKHEFHLLNDNYTIGHIIHTWGSPITIKDNGSISVVSKYQPKNIVLTFYFGGAK